MMKSGEGRNFEQIENNDGKKIKPRGGYKQSAHHTFLYTHGPHFNF